MAARYPCSIAREESCQRCLARCRRDGRRSESGSVLEFDIERGAGEDAKVMLKRLRAMRPLAAAVVVALVAVLSAACLAAERLTPEQRACCAAMQHNCGKLALTEGCCGPSEGAQSLGAMNRVEAPAHVFALEAVAVIVLPEPLVFPQHRALAAPSTVKPPGLDILLLNPSLRI